MGAEDQQGRAMTESLDLVSVARSIRLLGTWMREIRRGYQCGPMIGKPNLAGEVKLVSRRVWPVRWLSYPIAKFVGAVNLSELTKFGLHSG